MVYIFWFQMYNKKLDTICTHTFFHWYLSQINFDLKHIFISENIWYHTCYFFSEQTHVDFHEFLAVLAHYCLHFTFAVCSFVYICPRKSLFLFCTSDHKITEKETPRLYEVSELILYTVPLLVFSVLFCYHFRQIKHQYIKTYTVKM